MALFKKMKGKIDKFNEGRKAKAENEKLRKEGIASGEFDEIKVECVLEKDEKAYKEYQTDKFAIVEKIEEKTIGTTKRKGIIGRAVVGGVLLGPLGALGGAATSGSQQNSKTVQAKRDVVEKVDSGKLIMTNKRFLFLGNNVSSINLKDLMQCTFKDGLLGTKIIMKYPGMLKGEYITVKGKDAKDAELYFEGVKNKRS